MIRTMDVEPDNERDFLNSISSKGLYFPIKDNFELGERVVLRWKSITSNDKMCLQCVVVGRCFDGDNRVATSIKLVVGGGNSRMISKILDQL